MRDKVFKISGFFVLATSIVMAWFAMEYSTYIKTPMNIPEQGLRYEIKSGMTLTSVVRDLSQQGVLNKPVYLRVLAKLQGTASNIQAGEYAFSAGLTPAGFLDMIVNGQVIQYALTIVEGWNYTQLMEAVNNHEHLVHTLNGLDQKQLMTKIGYPGEHPEGRFYPDTYLFPTNTTDSEFLKRAYEAMVNKLNEEWSQRVGALPFDTPYEALILASIVEKETAVPEERKAISGVFVRRLEKKMRLQTDPTVIYGMGDKYDGNIKLRDLKKDTPYNTYRRKGLPPTPIAMPGGAAINAALHPLEGDELYFVARGDGSHKFSSTLKQHNNAVIKYQLKGRRKSFSSSP